MRFKDPQYDIEREKQEAAEEEARLKLGSKLTLVRQLDLVENIQWNLIQNLK